ncbi:MAG: HDOD domain-containing protein [Gammaproteobacteria bacterium]|nr:HDOD domain-containing protein [Gammaproteobacteria bacterium]
MYDIFVGRQPIYTPNLEIYGYELFFREKEIGEADIADHSVASYQVMLNSLLEIGLEQLVGNNRVFFNITPEVLSSEIMDSLDRNQVVLELADGTEVNDELITLLNHVALRGFTLALDNYVYLNSTRQLMNAARIVKINFNSMDKEELATQVKILRTYDVKLVAERLESKQQFELARSLGFDYYQGYFLTYPNILRGKRLPTNRVMVLQLQSKLAESKINICEIEELISKDVSISYRLLRYIHETQVSLSEPIESIHRAVTMVGLERIKQWVNLLAFSRVDDKPHELLMTTLTRAKMCELLAKAAGRQSTDSYFMVGLFSLVDELTGLPMDEVIKSMPVCAEIKQALVEHGGDMGSALECTIAYENSNWDKVVYANLDNQAVIANYMEAIEWAGDLGAELMIA